MNGRALCVFEEEARARGFKKIAGVDEAGRGPLAGPVVAAACMLPEGLFLEGVNDSKQLTPKQRMALYERIVSEPSLCYGIGVVDALLIDQINILRATFEAMLIAVANLKESPDYILVDGSQLPPFTAPAQAIVQGDARSQSIAAASILAKVTRDVMMAKYHNEWPMYGFNEHKGYGTKRHLEALREFGPCPLHRKSFDWGQSA